MSETTLNLLVALVRCVFVLALILQVLPLVIWFERKGAAYIQDRPGPNRADILGVRAAGLVHALPDVIKLITKEDIVPSHVNRGMWNVAPMISVFVAFVTMIVVPWGDTVTIPAELATAWLGTEGAYTIRLQAADINGGVLYVLAMTSLGVYGIMLAGWASNNKFGLLGGLRSSAQMVSYELSMGLALVALFMVFGTVQLDDIMTIQSHGVQYWGVLLAPPVGLISFLLFWVAVFAECNRTPFDLPEAEAELVAGYHTEYSGLRFAMFMSSEYANIIAASAVTATLFFGGYNVPFLNGAALRTHVDTLLMVIGAGGVPLFFFLSWVAFGRRNRKLYKVLPANDPRHREWKLFTAVWALAGLAHIGVIGLGASGLVSGSSLLTDIVVMVTQLNMLVVKILIGAWIMVWVRWTVPRFRYDQLMNLGWKVMLPIGLANVALAAVWLLVDASFLHLYSFDFHG